MTAALKLLWNYWYLVAIAALVAALGFSHLQTEHARTDLAEYTAKVADNARLAALARAKESEDARTEEQRRIAEKDRNVQQARLETRAAVDAARAADAVADRLRQQTARLSAAIRAATRDPQPGTGVPTAVDPGAALDLLTGLLSRTDNLAGELAKAVDRSRTAGLSCERAYDALMGPRSQRESALR